MFSAELDRPGDTPNVVLGRAPIVTPVDQTTTTLSPTLVTTIDDHSSMSTTPTTTTTISSQPAASSAVYSAFSDQTADSRTTAGVVPTTLDTDYHINYDDIVG